jgi:RimJ/RimL family protein N-acetyltransferase
MPVPLSIETPRLLLRQFVQDDWTAMHEQYSDIECTRYTSQRPHTEGQSWRIVASMAGHWALRGYGPYAVVELAGGAVIGTVGLWFPNDWPEPEIKWGLTRRYWGNGYAAEAVRAVQPVAVAHFDGRSPISLIDRENVRSLNLASAVGAVLEQVVEFRGGPWLMYRHPQRRGEA